MQSQGLPEHSGWANFVTFNVALWLNNDYNLHCVASVYRRYPEPYEAFVKHMRVMYAPELISTQTPDAVAWSHPDLDTDALDALIRGF